MPFLPRVQAHLRRYAPGVRTLARTIPVTIALSACVGDLSEEPNPANANVRDSLGIAVVEYRAPVQPSDGWWEVSTTPTLTIGELDGDPAQLFSVIRDLARLSDGSIVVLDGMSNEVRYFDSEGTHRFTAGGSGGGPGEFRQASSIVGTHGDSVMVHDLFASRLALFGPDGSLERSVQLTLAPGFTPAMTPLGFTSDDRIVIRGMAGPPPPDFGPAVVKAPFYLADPDATDMEAIADVPFAIMSTDHDGTPLPVFPMVVPVQVPSGSGLWTGTAMKPEFRKIGWDGEVERIVRFLDAQVALTAAETERIVTWYRERTASVPTTSQTPVEPTVLPQVPAFARILVDVTEHVWIQEVVTDRDPANWEFGAPRGDTRWRVIDPDGIWLGSVEMPDGFQPHAIGDDHLLGVWTNEDGVEFVHLHELSRG